MKYTECIYGKNCALRQNTYTRTGYTFLGWSTDDASKSATYKDMHEFKPFNLDTFNSSRNDEGITLYAVWRINKVHIQYNVNGGNIQSSTTSSGGTIYDWSIKNGLIYKGVNNEPILFEQTIEHGKSTDDNGLKNYNNSKYINISNEYHSGVEGKEWVCLSGCTTTNKKFDHTKTYSSNDFCDTTSSDCTVILGVNWRNNVAYIKYNAAGGTIQTETTHNNKTYRWKTVGDIIYRTYNDEETHTFDKIEYGKTNDLSNPDGPTYMIITKEGRSVADENGIDWICNSGNCTQKEYREDTNYNAVDICDVKNEDCTVELKVNWILNTYTISYEYNGGSKGTYAPSEGTFDKVVRISNPKKTLKVNFAAGVNADGITIPDAVSQEQQFIGWTYKSGNTSTAKYGSSSTTVTTRWSSGSKTVTAEYFKNLRSTSGTVTLTANWTPVAVALPSISKPGYNCNWNTQSDGKGTRYASGASYTPSAISGQSITVYASCTPNTYKIKYNANGGAGSMSETACAYDQNCTISTNIFTRTGYTFNSWNTKSDGTGRSYSNGQVVKNLSDTSGGIVTLYAVWRINKVHIQYNVNGGNIQSSTTSSGGTIYDWSIKNGLIYKGVNNEPILFEQTIEHGKSTDDNGLKNYNNSKYINISNEYHSGVEGKEWVCLSGCTTTNKKFDHTKTYSSNDFCDTTSSDCTVILGVNWRNNVAYIKYNAAGGTIQTETTHNNKTYRWKTVGDIIYRTYNDEETHTFDKIEYGKTNDLSNPDGPTYMIITKEGRSVADENGIDWICNSGNCTQNEYREDTNYEATDLCDLSKKDCTIELKVNWRWNYVYIKLYTNGGTITSSTIYNDKTYSWKKDSKNLIERTLNNEKSTTFENVRYDKTNDLPKPNGSYMTITKTGYIVKSEEEWKCRSNSNCVKETYDESVSYNSKDFCDATSRDCTIELEVNWIPDTYTISYDYNGGSKGSTAPTTATYDNIFNISNPTKTVTITGDANGTGATIGNATSKAQTFAGWTYSDGNTSYAKYGTASTSVTTSWSNGSTKVTAEYFKNLRSTSGTVTLTANWTPVALNLPTISKTGYSCNWNTQSDGKGTSYASGASYTPSATSDQSITVYARCTPYKVFINYKNNNGTLTETTKKSDGSATYNWTTDSNKIIMLNGNAPFFSVKYGNDLGTNGLVNYDNDNYLHISRTGYVAISGEEWICASDNCKGKTYSDSQVYNASDFCDASNGNCTVVLEVNWSQYENKWVQGVKDSYTISPIRTWGGFSAKLRITWKEEYNQYLNQSRVSIINFEMYYPSGGGLGPFYVGGASGETDGIYINDEYVQPMSLVDGKTDFAWSSTAGWKPLNLKPRDYPWTSTEITHKADGTKSVPIKVVLDSTYQNLKFGAAYDDTKYITLTDLR